MSYVIVERLSCKELVRACNGHIAQLRVRFKMLAQRFVLEHLWVLGNTNVSLVSVLVVIAPAVNVNWAAYEDQE